MAHYKIEMEEIEIGLKDANELQKVLNHNVNVFFDTIEDVYDLHFDLAWAIQILSFDVDDDDDKYLHLLKLSTMLTGTEFDYLEIMKNKKAPELETQRAEQN